jgi:apolipoprotein D and lipocalin family protein
MVARRPGRFRVSGSDCASGQARGYATEAALTGPGRITMGRGETLWILWVDADYRVAAVGTPSGAFGRILSRDPQPRPDLLRAAREVLEFNGYDVSRLAIAR